MNRIQELNSKLVKVANELSTEEGHMHADVILCEAIEYLGEEAGFREDVSYLIANFKAMAKWYAIQR